MSPPLQFRVANLSLLIGVPLALVPFWEDAARLPKLLLLLWGAALLLGAAPDGLRGSRSKLALALVGFYLWRAVAPFSFSAPVDLRSSMLAYAVVGLAWLAHPPGPLVCRGVLGLAAFETGLAVVQFSGLSTAGYGEIITPRAMGTLGNSNSLCLWLLPLALLAWERERPRLALWLLLGASLSGARAGLVAGLVASGYLAFQLSTRDRSRLAAALVVPILVMGLFQLRGPQRSIEGPQLRLALWTAAAALVEEHPLGLGPGRFGLAYLPYRGLEPESARGQSRLPQHCHSELLGLGVEAGWPALVLAAVVLVLAWLRLESPHLKAALLVMAVQGLFFRFSPPVELLWLYLLTWSPESSEAGKSGGYARLLPGLALVTVLLVLTLPWGWAERQAWLAREAELKKDGPGASLHWNLAWKNAAPSRKPTLRRRFLASQLALDSSRGEIDPAALRELHRSDLEPDPYIWSIRARFMLRSQPMRAHRAFLQACLRDPWNRSFEKAARAPQKSQVE